ncbi:glycoside hydrolase family 43 protein, putative [Rhizoctonia solani AG-3 Rhs1AP]|uniref:Glycoside hydrolase family 43 protein, putative n=1 Tax=Rhizoctonia solani AG-3 Rhs1AP TaxID=1086054 RepID=X8IYS2_9AGAM|nr:glycoside hydrolase family 43 protein, putative [Rhizoctonia solani AG-3 Rhs1AP]
MVLLVVNPSHEDARPARDTTGRQPSPRPRVPSVSPRTHTVNLPPELIRLIILRVTRTPDLASLALTSRYSNNVATPLLYSTLSFGPAAYRCYKLSGRSRGASGHGYVSISPESPMGRGEVGSEDNFFDSRSSLCAELLSRSSHLLSYVRSVSTNATVPNYAAAVRAARGQRTSEENTFHEWVTILALPQASSVRHLALGNVNDQHLLALSTARHFKLTALELSVPPAALPELSHLSTFLQRQRHITHFCSRNLADIEGISDRQLPRLTHIAVPAILACQLAPGRPITTARIFPLATRRGPWLRSADELLMAIDALAQSTDSVGVADLDVSVLWYGDHRMGDDCRAFFAAIRDSLQGLRHLRITLWSDLAPNNVDILFDCILSTLPSLRSLETFEIRTWAEYGISHPSHLPHPTRRALFDLWKELCPSLKKVAALENHTWTWHAARTPTRHPIPVRSNSDPDTKMLARRPLPPRPRPASGNWVRLSGGWDWQPTASPTPQSSSLSNIPSTSRFPTNGFMTSVSNPQSRSTTPNNVHDPRTEGAWVQEPRKQPCYSPKMWHLDLPIVGSTYQRNELDEHYVRIAHSEHIQFAARDMHRVSIV